MDRSGFSGDEVWGVFAIGALRAGDDEGAATSLSHARFGYSAGFRLRLALVASRVAPWSHRIPRQGMSRMTEEPVALDDLVRVREALIADAVGGMPEAHRRFLLSFEAGAPDWSLLGAPNAATLPVVQWRMENLTRLDGR